MAKKLSDTSGDRAPRTGRWVRILLVVSLGLNLLIAGVVAGAWMSGGPGAPGFAERGPGGVSRAFVQALDRSDQRALRRGLQQIMRDKGWTGGRSRPDPDTIRNVLTAEPVSVEALERLLGDTPTRGIEVLQTGRDMLIARISAMPAEARAAYAERVITELQRKQDRRHRR